MEYLIKCLKVFFLELEISSLSPTGCGPVFKYLFMKHEELETISIELYTRSWRTGLYGVKTDDYEWSTEDVKDIVLTIFSNIHLRSISLVRLNSTEDIFSCLSSTLPNLEKLELNGWCSLSDQELVKILNRSRSSLREICLFDSYNITGVGVKEGVKSLPNLEVLNLSWCLNLTDGGLKEILKISGIKLRVLDVFFISIPAQGFKDGVSLPMLEELNLSRCRALTDSGLLEILSITGSRLKTVRVSDGNGYISTAVRSTLSTQYPSVQFKYDL